MLNERMKSVNRAVMKKRKGNQRKNLSTFEKKKFRQRYSKKCEDFARDNEYVGT